MAHRPTLTWLDGNTPFPPPDHALGDPPGLLAIGGDLSLARLRNAYRHGIFPWGTLDKSISCYGDDAPLLWWSPDPRMVLACEAFAPSHSLRKRLRAIARHENDAQPPVQIRVDTAFARVIAACAAPRPPVAPASAGTWITPAIARAYCDWHNGDEHRAGDAHSVETWIDGELVGGLYGVSLGGIFFGESMFARATDASKVALAYLVRFLLREGTTHIDCQQVTPHLARLGARPEPRAEFLARLATLTLATRLAR